MPAPPEELTAPVPLDDGPSLARVVSGVGPPTAGGSAMRAWCCGALVAVRASSREARREKSDCPHSACSSTFFPSLSSVSPFSACAVQVRPLRRPFQAGTDHRPQNPPPFLSFFISCFYLSLLNLHTHAPPFRTATTPSCPPSTPLISASAASSQADVGKGGGGGGEAALFPLAGGAAGAASSNPPPNTARPHAVTAPAAAARTASPEAGPSAHRARCRKGASAEAEEEGEEAEGGALPSPPPPPPPLPTLPPTN